MSLKTNIHYVRKNVKCVFCNSIIDYSFNNKICGDRYYCLCNCSIIEHGNKNGFPYYFAYSAYLPGMKKMYFIFDANFEPKSNNFIYLTLSDPCKYLSDFEKIIGMDYNCFYSKEDLINFINKINPIILKYKNNEIFL
jgi:hypothetical protein